MFQDKFFFTPKIKTIANSSCNTFRPFFSESLLLLTEKSEKVFNFHSQQNESIKMIDEG